MVMINLRCPNCNAELSVNDDRDFLFCEYCGHKILLNNKKEFKYTYHEINEAKIRKAEAHEKIELKKLENERRSSRLTELIFIISFCFILLAAAGPFLMDFFSDYKFKKYEENLSGETITVPFSSSNLTSEKYEAAYSELVTAGFTNINSIPMNDLGLFDISDNGKVSEVSIDGITSFKAGSKFPKNAIAIVRYHSLK